MIFLSKYKQTLFYTEISKKKTHILPPILPQLQRVHLSPCSSHDTNIPAQEPHILVLVPAQPLENNTKQNTINMRSPSQII